MASVPFRVIAATLASCLATACGGSNPTKKDVIARANAICSTAVSSARAVTPPAAGNSPSALAGYFRRLTPIVAREVAQLRKLPRPSADKPLLDRYVDAITSAGVTYSRLLAAARNNDAAAVAKYLSALRVNPAQSLARRYGLTQCAASAGTSP